jgi:two-component system cell cycle response regulator
MTARILVVDDIPANVKLLEAKLSAEYYEVLTAASGQECLDVARAKIPDLILLDIMMPGMDGFEVCTHLKGEDATAHIPVIMVTALSEISDRVKGLEAGADDFLSKPVNDTALFARVRSLLRLKMMMDELRVRQETSGQLGIMETDEGENGDNARVLVIENSEFTARRVASYLEEAGHLAERVQTSQDGLTRARAEDFDLIIVGIEVDGEDGLRLCSQLRSQEESRHVPQLMLLEDTDMPRLAKGLDLGVSDYIVKPLDRGELLARVRTQVRRRRYHERLRMRIQKSVSMAFTDPLTGLFNRRYLTTHLDRKLLDIGQNGKPVSVAIFDVDLFKEVNDTYGHGPGDEVLKLLATVATNNLRSIDLVARYGGEEFVVVMPETTREQAGKIIERLRKRVAQTDFPIDEGAKTLSLTISIGVATTDNPDDMAEDVLERADAALYDAKHAGRNCSRAAEAGEAWTDAPAKADIWDGT